MFIDVLMSFSGTCKDIGFIYFLHSCILKGKNGIFRLPFALIDCRFITRFAIVSYRFVWLNDIISQPIYSYVVFLLYCSIISNAWCEVSFLKSINHCATNEGGELSKQKKQRNIPYFNRTGSSLYHEWVSLSLFFLSMCVPLFRSIVILLATMI